MLVGVDANLSNRIARALSSLYSNQSNPEKPDFHMVGEGAAQSDVQWIGKFSDDGGTSFLGCDKQILNKPHEVKALYESGLSACFFDFGGQKLHLQAALVVYWWPKLEELFSNENEQIVCRLKATNRLTWSGLEQMRFVVDKKTGRPKVERFTVEF